MAAEEIEVPSKKLGYKIKVREINLDGRMIRDWELIANRGEFTHELSNGHTIEIEFEPFYSTGKAIRYTKD